MTSPGQPVRAVSPSPGEKNEPGNTAAPDTNAARSLPRATYRLQLNPQFTFRHARDIVPYLAQLGFSDLHLSPVFTARPHSTHGYDVCDFTRFNPDLGGARAFDELVRALRRHRFGLVLDVVPNHMGVHHTRNHAWMDVLRRGPRSSRARWFDIDWRSSHPGLQGRILLPILGDHFGRVLERGELRLVVEHRALWVAYHGLRFPISKESLRRAPRHRRRTGSDALSLAQIAQRLNGRPGDSTSYDALAELLDRQHYRLAFWKTGLEQLNYRRFFDVTHLAGLRVEEPDVFRHVHTLLPPLIRRGVLRGLRIDHPDGLRDPAAYLHQVQQLFRLATSRSGSPAPSALVVLEKILADGEELPLDWPAAGTTGYDVLNWINNLFVDSRAERPFDQLHREFTRCHRRFDEERYYNKLRVVRGMLAPELDSLCRQLAELLASDRHGRDYTTSQTCTALAGIIAALPVYRTYLNNRHGRMSLVEQRYWVVAVDTARRHHPDVPEALWDLLGAWLVLGDSSQTTPDRRHALHAWILRLQQVTAAAMAKGLEDTTFYTWTRFASLNEVGGNPARFGVDPGEFHAAIRQRAIQWPRSFNVTTTHDTKRGEDTRARLDVLSEMPLNWRRRLRRWRDWNAAFKTCLGGLHAPDPNDEYLIYQTLVGTWPVDGSSKPANDYVERLQAYHLKAAREAKTETNWIQPHLPYENALHDFIHALLDPRRSPRFLSDLKTLAAQIALPGFCNSLAQTLLKLSLPGIPDTYQGSELWDFSLVDPDNRRPVDYARRQEALDALKRLWSVPSRRRASAAESLARKLPDARAKLFVHWRCLHLRSELPDLFHLGNYEPLSARGPRARHICAFRRVWRSHEILVVVPRLVLGLTRGRGLPTGAVWGNTSVEWESGPRRFRNLFTDELLVPERAHRPPDVDPSRANRRPNRPSQGCSLRVAAILRRFPVALLQADP
jgi:(1->4)-alpha-D-glucan 1-alpha-D-glucosylmutase